MNLPSPTPTLARLNPHLFNSQPQRSAAGLGVASEEGLHDEIFFECRRRGWLAFHGSMAAATHRTMGEPDFVILVPAGHLLLVECKSRIGKLSPAQLAIKAHAEKLGHTVHIVRSFQEFLEITGKIL